jgi:hypothetical protein
MLGMVKQGADFSMGCAHPMIANAIRLTRSLKIREVALATASHSKDERDS